MALFRATVAADSALIEGRGVYLRPPQPSDYEAWATVRAASRHFLMPWEPVWPADDLTRVAFRRRLRRYANDAREDLGYAYLLFRREDHALAGGLTLSHVRRGVAQACTLGYWMGEAYAGRGLMTAAVQALKPHMFGALRFHRVEAACMPRNRASIRVLEKAGFVQEGFARRYLCIAGAWEDHLLFAALAGEGD